MSAFPTPVSLATRRGDLDLASAANVAAATVAAQLSATAVKPVTGAGVIVVDLAALRVDNHALIWPFSSVATTAVDLLVVGWKRCRTTGLYEPMPLTQVQWVPDSANAQTIAGASMYPALGFTKNLGDCKLYPGSASYKVNGFLSVDTWGAELLALAATRTSGTPNFNAKLAGC